MKLLRLTTLVALAAASALALLPSLQSLLTSERQPRVLENSDAIAVVVPGNSGYKVIARIQSDYYSASAEPPIEAASWMQIQILSDVSPPLAQPYYIIATGLLTDWFARCEGTVDEPTTGTPQSLPIEVVPEAIALQLRKTAGGQPFQVYQVFSHLISCPVPGDQIWSTVNGQVKFGMPSIEAATADHQGSDLNNRRQHCIEIGVTYPSELAVSYQGSSATPPADPTWRMSNSWNDCRIIEEAPGVFLEYPPLSLQSGIGYSYVGTARLGLTDLQQAAEEGRNLFFAGVFAGLLGALLIEILNAAFEVMELRNSRRRLPQSESESEPEPDRGQADKENNTSAIDDMNDRDQLPLF